MEKKSNFVQVPLWLLSELSGKEIKLFCRMYNGWCLMQDADGWYYRSISKLKEDADIKSKCNNEVINAILHFEELGIVIVERNGKKTNKFKFNEHLMFNYEEYDTNDSEEGCMQNTYKGCMQNTYKGCMQNTYKGCMQNTYKQVEGDVCKMHTIYNTKENIKEYNTHVTIVHVPEDKNENTMNDMKYNDEFITENDRDAWEVLSMDDDFDYTQYSDIAEMVKRDAGSSKCNENKNKSMYDERNAWITRLFERLDSTLNLLSQCYDKGLVAGKDGYGDTLNKLFKSGDSKVEAGWFTEKQLYKYQGYINRYNGLMRDRRDRFNVKDTMTASNENSIISTGLSESVEGGGCAAPRFTNEDYLNALKKVFIEDLGWSLSTFYSRMGYGMYDYRKKVADILGVNVDRIDGYKFEKDIEAILPNDMVVEEPMVAYGNSSVQEAQQQFAMALAANG